MATIIRTNGRAEVIRGAGKDGLLTLEQLQEAVGGNIEAVYALNPGIYMMASKDEDSTTVLEIEPGSCMFINEEGKLLQQPMNPIASEMYQAYPQHDVIVGDVIVCGPDEFA